MAFAKMPFSATPLEYCNRLIPMKIYQFADPRLLGQIDTSLAEIHDTVMQVSEGTATHDLVVSHYLVETHSWSGGAAYTRIWMTPETFATNRGKWRITSCFTKPENLPPRFKLIRLLPLSKYRPYPIVQKDGYGWEYQYNSFRDQVATLFAHELHHFRRYHLGLHTGEGEKSANRWALAHVQSLGFKVVGRFVDGERERTLRAHQVTRRVQQLKNDPFRLFRGLEKGARILVSFDPSGRYLNQIAMVERSIRPNSRRMVIRTIDGKIWRWPMLWLQSVE